MRTSNGLVGTLVRFWGVPFNLVIKRVNPYLGVLTKIEHPPEAIIWVELFKKESQINDAIT